MNPWPSNPLIYEINTWTWLRGLCDRSGRAITLGTVPDAELDALAAWGFDAIWLMGVWERSPASREIARVHPDLQAEFRAALPDFSPADVVGSPYAIHRYAVDPHLGTRDELAGLRQRLAARGLRLVLDFVPNHVAHDHPWLETHPEYFLHGTDQELAAQPDHFFRQPGTAHPIIFANGRDPYFPAWTDTAQLNAFSPGQRAAAIDVLRDLTAQCDGVRCDMAMLVTTRVFLQTWGERAGQPPAVEYWEDVIPAIKAQQPDFLFISEVYWNMEWELQQQGFDYTYDKRLYDRLKKEPARSILAHVQSDPEYQRRLVRMIENHDEERAVVALGPEKSRAAAVFILMLPGARLLHEGQFQGHRVKLPVQLGRRPPEPDDPALEAFYRLLLDEARQPTYHAGEWHLRAATFAWDLNASYINLMAYSWRYGAKRRLIVVNYAASSSQGRIPLPGLELEGRTWTLLDRLDGVTYERSGDAMADAGLYIDLRPWQAHLFEFQ